MCDKISIVVYLPEKRLEKLAQEYAAELGHPSAKKLKLHEWEGGIGDGKIMVTLCDKPGKKEE